MLIAMLQVYMIFVIVLESKTLGKKIELSFNFINLP